MNMDELNEEYAGSETFTVGQTVEYNGSISEYHGLLYVVTEIGPGLYGQPGALTLKAEGGQGLKFGDAGSVLRNVRAKSVKSIN